MPVVTRDATSGIWYPATAAEVTSLYSGRGIGAPVHGYLCQEAAGNLADFIGAVPLVKFNAPQYQVAFPGHTRKAIGYNANNDCHFYSPVTANDVGDITNVSSSVLIFGAAANSLGSAPPTQVKNMVNLGSGANARNFQWSATSKYQIAGGGGQATGTGTATPGVGVHGAIVEVNRTGTALVVQDDQETISPTYTAPAAGTAYLSIGPDAVGDAGQTLTLVGYMLMWAGANAEFTAAQRASIIDCHYNGPAVASIAATPTPFTLSSIGATQQLTAIATRTDTTTYDCTNGTNIPSTATATWTSDNPGVATVSATGLVTAVANGVANITRAVTSLNAATATSNNVVVTVSASVSPVINATPVKIAATLDPLAPPGIGIWR